MTYGCETWELNNAMMDKLAVAQCKMERIILQGRHYPSGSKAKHLDPSRNWCIKAISSTLSQKQRVLDGQVTLPSYLIIIGPSEKQSPRDWTKKQGHPKTRWRDDLTRQQIRPLWSRLARHMYRHLWNRSREGFSECKP